MANDFEKLIIFVKVRPKIVHRQFKFAPPPNKIIIFFDNYFDSSILDQHFDNCVEFRIGISNILENI